MALLVLIVGITYAEYKQEDEVLFINARVGKFVANDIQLAMTLDGEEVETPPEKNSLYQVTVNCDNATGLWDMNKRGATITEITSGKVKCEVNFSTPEPTLSDVTATSDKTSISLSYTAGGIGTSTTCEYGTSEGNYENSVEEVQNTGCNIAGLEMDTTYYYKVCARSSREEDCKTGNIKTLPEGEHINIVKVGDFISMTPTSTSYTPLKEDTGCLNDSNCTQNTIIPSELNLWRVIKKNDDGTIEVVSEYTSSVMVNFYGEKGYMNLVGALDTISAQYTNSKYVESTRHMGDNGQEKRCLGAVDRDNDSACPGIGKTTLRDITDVYRATGKYIGQSVTGEELETFLAVRVNNLENGSAPITGTKYGGVLWEGGKNSSVGISNRYLIYYEGDIFSGYLKREMICSGAIRPILILKSTTKIVSGDGKAAETAYQLG